MKIRHLALAIPASFALSGCELIGDIFEAGVWTGIILVLLIGGGIAWLASRLFK